MLAPACLPRSLWWEKRTERGPLVSQLAGCVDLGDTASQLLEWLASLRVLASTSSDRAGGRKRGRKGDWLTPIPIAADAASFLTFSGATSYVQRSHKPVYRLVSAWRMFDCCEINLARHRSPETTSPSKRVLAHPSFTLSFLVYIRTESTHKKTERLLPKIIFLVTGRASSAIFACSLVRGKSSGSVSARYWILLAGRHPSEERLMNIQICGID